MRGKGSLREAMPETAAFLDELRRIFGTADINIQIRKGLAGEPTFHAVENGHEIGTQFPERHRVTAAEMVLEEQKGNERAKNSRDR